MKWLTEAQVKKAAKTAKGALAITKTHWWQNANATEEELKEYWNVGGGHNPVAANICGLCLRYDESAEECGACPLRKVSKCYQSQSTYRLADNAWHDLKNAWHYDEPAKRLFNKWQKAAQKMYKVLLSLEK